MQLSTAIAEAFERACRAELEAPKPGNVHVFAGGHAMTVADFIRSAEAAAPFIACEGASVGRRIFDAVAATFAVIGQNTNLGIVLLCAPLAAAAERNPSDLPTGIRATLAALDVEDARLAFEAIRRAAPGGLGRAPLHDVRSPARVSLLQAMVEAAERDRIARQYATGFSDVFAVGVPALEGWRRPHADPRRATLGVYLTFLSAFPDTHIARRQGEAVATTVMQRAGAALESLEGAASLEELQGELLAWDQALKAEKINPGTSADLTVATLFAVELQGILRSVRKSG
jgi:triphosphoribosyl-dephospho-CoA synthase